MSKKFNELTSEEKKNGFIGLIVIVIVAFVAIKACEYKSKPSEEQLAHIIEIEAPKLASEFQRNEIKAEHDYKDKQLSVTGTITEINNTGSGEIVLKSTYDSYILNTVKCSLENKETALNLNIGDQITLDGICQGMYGNQIDLLHCKKHDQISK